MEKNNNHATLEDREELAPYEAKSPRAEALSMQQVQRLVHLLNTTDITEIEVKQVDAGLRLALRKFVQPGCSLPLSEGEPGESTEPDPHQATEAGLYRLTAPLVGVFHPWLKPRGKALVAVGDLVKAGQVVGTVEALTLLNEVETTVCGRVKELHVQDGQAVEYGQVLLTIDCSEKETPGTL